MAELPARHPAALPALSGDTAPRANLAVMAGAFTIFGLSLAFQSHRWASTPAYHVLLQILPARAWGVIFLVSGLSMGLASWQYGRRWLLIGTLTLAFALTSGWMLAFIARYLTSSSTTPETWVSWAVFGFLLLRVALSIDFDPVPPPLPADPVLLAALRETREAMHKAGEAGGGPQAGG